MLFFWYGKPCMYIENHKMCFLDKIDSKTKNRVIKGIRDAYKTVLGNHNEVFTASDGQSETAFKSQMSANTHTNTHRSESGDFHCLPSNTKVLLINADQCGLSHSGTQRRMYSPVRCMHCTGLHRSAQSRTLQLREARRPDWRAKTGLH